ncbi:MAG TPA: hypothetical protein VJ396_01160 [Acidiferrobacterales bacterium]|nr:hypothetical protein [Acidiferrobacterales bacterium]
MSELRTSVSINLAGNLERAAARYTRSMQQFASRGSRYLRGLSNAAATTGRMLDRVGNRYTALLTGAGAIGTAKMVVDLEMRFTRLAIQANEGADAINALKKNIYDAAQAPDIRVDPSEITSAIEAIIEKTGDLKFARDNIRNIGLAIQATGAQGGAIGDIMAEFQKMGMTDPKKVLETIDTLNLQGKEGAFTLANLAALGPRVVTAYTAMGRSGPQAMREMGAALQVIRMGTGEARQAATAFEAVMRTLADAEKIKQLKELAGIDVFDPERLKKGERVLRPINELMAEIVKKSGGDMVKLSQVFDAEAMRAFNQAAGEFQRTGKLDTLEKFMQVQGDGKATMDDSARAAKTASAALTNLYTAWKKFADESLTGPIQSLANVLNALGSETTGKIIKGLAIGGAVLGGAVIARKTYNGVRGLFGGGGVAGGALGGLPLPLPVFVTNPGAAGGLAGAAGRGGFLKSFGARALGAAGAGYAGYEIGGAISRNFIEGTAASDVIGRITAGFLSAFGNSGARAALESERRARELSGTIKLEVTTADGVSVRSRGAQMDNDVDVEVESGLSMGGGW